MGQLVRMRQADRFVQQFGELEIGLARFKPGDKLTFVQAFLGRVEGSGEEVTRGYEFKAEDGTTVSLYEESPLFIPTYLTTVEEELEAGVHERYGLSEEEFRRRWEIVMDGEDDS